MRGLSSAQVGRPLEVHAPSGQCHLDCHLSVVSNSQESPYTSKVSREHAGRGWAPDCRSVSCC